MFGSIPQPTPFDLHWRMFGIEVRVHPLFWLMAAFMGWQGSGQDAILLLFIWILCVFFSILIHELGHVFMGRLFGAEGHILLYSFGGLAIGSNGQRHRWQRILVDLGGVIAQFMLLGLVVAAVVLVKTRDLGLSERAASILDETLGMLLDINIFWPLLNLLPIWPLDGGQVSRELCEGASRRRGLIVSLGISVGVAGVLAVVLLLLELRSGLNRQRGIGDFYLVLLFGLLAFGSYQLLQIEQNRGRLWDDEDRRPWE